MLLQVALAAFWINRQSSGTKRSSRTLERMECMYRLRECSSSSSCHGRINSRLGILYSVNAWSARLVQKCLRKLCWVTSTIIKVKGRWCYNSKLWQPFLDPFFESGFDPLPEFFLVALFISGCVGHFSNTLSTQVFHRFFQTWLKDRLNQNVVPLLLLLL